jgi:hypothetical protein
MVTNYEYVLEMADFTITPDGVLVGYSGAGGAIVVPDTVTKVGWAAFRDMSTVTSVTLPTDVTEIAPNAFMGCTNLTTVTGPIALRFVGFQAFYGTQVLEPPFGVTIRDGNLHWVMPENQPDGISSFKIFLGNTEIATVAGDVTSLMIDGQLPAGRTGVFRVQAFDSTGRQSLKSAAVEYAVPKIFNTLLSGGILERSAGSIAMTANGARVFVGDISNNLIQVSDASGSSEWTSNTVATLAGCTALATSADGKLLVVATESQTSVFSEEEGGVWSSVTTLAGGRAVAVSPEGQVIAIGDPTGDGLVCLYKQKGGGTWALEKTFRSDIGTLEALGCSVALTAGGSVLAVGAENAMGHGVVRLYSGPHWSVQSNLYGEAGSWEGFGKSLAISTDGKTLLVGAPRTGTTTWLGSFVNGYGSASLWTYDQGASTWTRKKTFYGVGGLNRSFGTRVALSSNGNTLMIAERTRKVCIYAVNGDTWPLIATLEQNGQAGALALSCTGDRLAWGGQQFACYQYVPERTFQCPSITTLLAASSMVDPASATDAARCLVQDIQITHLIAPGMAQTGIRVFTSVFIPDATAVATALIASNFLTEDLNATKQLLYRECVETLGVTADNYFELPSDYIEAIVESVDKINREDGYLPPSLFVYFPSSDVIDTNVSVTSILYCLTPGTTYSFGSNTLNYRRRSDLLNILLGFPGSQAFIPPTGNILTEEGSLWRRLNVYGGRESLLESAIELNMTAVGGGGIFNLDDYIKVAWLSTDLILSNNAEERKVGELFAQEYLPYARGAKIILEFNASGSTIIKTGQFVGAADRSILFPSFLKINPTAVITQIEQDAFDMAVINVTINGASLPVSNGNITIHGADETRVWYITVRGVDILLPSAPRLVPTDGVLQIPSTVAVIPDGYFENTVASSVNFTRSSSANLQRIGRRAFPEGCRITDSGVTSTYLTYTGNVPLVRLSGIFYADYDGTPSVVWYRQPLRTTDLRVHIPPRSSYLDFICEYTTEFLVLEEPASDMVIWQNRFVDSRPLINTVSPTHFIRFSGSNYTNFRTSTGGVNVGPPSLAGAQTYKLLSTYHKADPNPAIEGINENFTNDVWSGLEGAKFIVPVAPESYQATIGSSYKWARYLFTPAALPEGQQVFHGNIGWRTSRTAGASRIESMMTSFATEGRVYFQSDAFTLYPHMFGVWRRLVSSIRESNGFDLEAPSGVPAFTFKDCQNLNDHAIVYDTSVGASAFENCWALTSIYAKDRPVARFGRQPGQASFTVGPRAFRGCNRLVDISMGSDVPLLIGTDAFRNCLLASQISLDSSGSITLGANAFTRCISAEAIKLRYSGALTYNNTVFQECIAVKSLYVECRSPNTVTIAAGFFNEMTGLTSIEIRSRGAVTIAAGAFIGCCSDASRLSIDCSGSVTIGDNAFNGCAGLCVIDINAGGTVTIGANAFNGCGATATEFSREVIPSRIVLNGGSSVTIGANAFTGVVSARAITVRNLASSNPFPFSLMPQLQTVSIHTAAALTLGSMTGCSALTTVDISGAALTIAATQFQNCPALQTLNVTNLLMGMEQAALAGCTSLHTVALAFAEGAVCRINALTSSPLTSVRLTGGSDLKIPATFCNGRTLLNTVDIVCKSVKPAESVTSITNLLSGCTQLQTLSINATAGPNSFVSFPSVLPALRTVNIQGSINIDGTPMWTNSVLERLTIRGVMFCELGPLPIATLRSVDVNNAVSTDLPDYHFMNYTLLERFKMSTVGRIGVGAFFGCAQLTDVNISSLAEIDDFAFANSGVSGEFVCPSQATSLGIGYFIGCPNLKKITYNCNVAEFKDPTRLTSNIWSHMSYLNDSVTSYDVSGLATIRRGDPTPEPDDTVVNISFATLHPTTGLPGAEVEVPSSDLIVNMSWTKYQKRFQALDDVVERLMFYHGNVEPDKDNSFMVGIITQVKSLGQMCIQSREILPLSMFNNISGWNPGSATDTADGRFTTLDASAQQVFGNPSANYSSFNAYIYPYCAQKFQEAIDANASLYNISSGDVSLPVSNPYTILRYNLILTGLTPLKVRLRLQQSSIDTITGNCSVSIVNNKVRLTWAEPTIDISDGTVEKTNEHPIIELEDGTYIDISGTVSRTLDNNPNLSSVLVWLATNETALSVYSSVGIALNGLTSSIEFLDFKKNTTIDISCATVTAYQFSMTHLVNTTVNIKCGCMTIDNNAFNTWSENSTLILDSLATPNVGVNVFTGSNQITVNSNQFLINSPKVYLANINQFSLDDVPDLIRLYARSSTNEPIEPHLTRNVKIGTFMPETNNVFPAGYSYIQFQELPSLQMHYILQQPEDWFYAQNKVPHPEVRDPHDHPVDLVYLDKFDVTDQDGNPAVVPMKHVTAPGEFTFLGHKFTRDLTFSTPIAINKSFNGHNQSSRTGWTKCVDPKEVTLYAIWTANQYMRTAMYKASPWGGFFNQLAIFAIGLAISLIVAIFTFGIGGLLAFSAVTATFSATTIFAFKVFFIIIFETGAAFLTQAIAQKIETGYFVIGQLTIVFWITLFISIALPIKGARFGKSKVFPPNPRSGGTIFVPKVDIIDDLVPLGPIQEGSVDYLATTAKAAGGRAPGLKPTVFGKKKVGLPDPPISIVIPAPPPAAVAPNVIRPRLICNRMSSGRLSLAKEGSSKSVLSPYSGPAPKPSGGLPQPRPPPGPPNPNIPPIKPAKITPPDIGPAARTKKPWEHLKKQNDLGPERVTLNPTDQNVFTKLNAQKIQLENQLKAMKPGTAAYNLLKSTYDELLVTLGRSILPLTNELQQNLLADLFLFMTRHEDCTSAITTYSAAQAAKAENSFLNVPVPANFNEYGAYNAQNLVPTISQLEGNGANIYVKETYLEAYSSMAHLEEPPFILPLAGAPSFTNEESGPVYHLVNFMGRGTNYEHSFVDRTQTGFPCQVWGYPNPLMLRSQYQWKETGLGSGTPVAARYRNNLDMKSAPSMAILTAGTELNSEVYLATRATAYTYIKQEATNVVYSGAHNVRVIIPDEVTSIPDYAFNSSTGEDGNLPFTVTDVIMGGSIRSIGVKAFYRAGLKTILYSDTTAIGAEAFAFNTSLSTLSLSSSNYVALLDGNYDFEFSLNGGTHTRFFGETLIIDNFTNAKISRNGVVLRDISNGTGFIVTSSKPAAITVLNLGDVINRVYTGFGWSVLNYETNGINYYAVTPLTLSVPPVTSYNITSSRFSFTTPITTDDGTHVYFAGTNYVLSDFLYGNDVYTRFSVLRQPMFFTVTSNTTVRLQNISRINVGSMSRSVSGTEVTAIGSFSFAGCSSLEQLEISPSCVEIGEGAYLNCEALREFVRLPVGMQTVGASAFAGTNITGIVIPSTVKSVGEFAIPDNACVVLEADAGGALTPALSDVFGCLDETNVVFVSTAEAMEQVLPFMSERAVRVLVEPLAPSGVRMEDGCVVWDTGRDSLAAPAYSYVVCVTSAETGEVVEEHVDVVRSGTCRLKSVGGEFLVSVVAQNPAGDSEATVISVVL